MSASDASELNFDALDSLLLQAEALDRELRISHPELYQDAPNPGASDRIEPPAHEDSFYFSSGAPALPREPIMQTAASVPEEPPLPVIDEDSLQAYFLRRKFEQLSPDSRWEHAAAGEPVSRLCDNPAQLPDEELFLFALSKLAAGVSNEAGNAISLMEQRGGNHALLEFLPAYMALETGASRSRIEKLAAHRPSAAPVTPEEEMVFLSRRMLGETMDVIAEAEALQEAGYRNRQEALQKAAQNVRQRISRINY